MVGHGFGLNMDVETSKVSSYLPPEVLQEIQTTASVPGDDISCALHSR